MATVTITDILGGDNIAASRIVINNNFTLLQNAINTLETRLNTSYVPGGSLNVGDIQVLRYNRVITTNIVLVQASAQIDGNLSVGTPTNNATLGVTGFLTVSDDLTVADNVTFSNTGSINLFNNNLRTITDDGYADLQFNGITLKNPVFTSSAITLLPITAATRVLYIDVTAWAVTHATDYTLPAVATLGQHVRIAFTAAASLAAAAVVFGLDNTTNFDPAFDNTALLGANIQFNSTIVANNPRFGGIWIDLVATATGWKVTGAHADVLYI